MWWRATSGRFTSSEDGEMAPAICFHAFSESPFEDERPENALNDRVAQLPDLPTPTELGFAADVATWHGLIAPAALPAPMLRGSTI